MMTWAQEQESRPCRRVTCSAQPGEHCVTVAGSTAKRSHAERWNDAMEARSLPFTPLEEGHHVSGRTGPKIRPRPVRPAREYDPRPVQGILDSPQVLQIIRELEFTRWTGRPGYPIRALV